MADIQKIGLYGFDIFRDKPEGLGLQYHLTVECDQYCEHCYMFNEDTYENQKRNPLSLQESKNLMDQYYSILDKYNLNGSIALTGGDPILSELFWPLLEYLTKYINRIRVSILGNSYHIDSQVANRLKELNVFSYQISLDGLGEMHDKIRKKGSFDDAIRAFKILHRAGIETHAMFTLSKENIQQLRELSLWVKNANYIDVFCFDRLIPIGNAKTNGIAQMDAKEYAEFLFECYKQEIISKQGIFYNRKDNLWGLLMYQLGLTNPIDKQEKKMISGCKAGVATITVLADGKVCTCRRIGEPVGDIRTESLEKIYRFNKQTQMLRKLDEFEECSECELRAYCRGCAAMKKAVGGSVYARDPQCWKNCEFD